MISFFLGFVPVLKNLNWKLILAGLLIIGAMTTGWTVRSWLADKKEAEIYLAIEKANSNAVLHAVALSEQARATEHALAEKGAAVGTNTVKIVYVQAKKDKNISQEVVDYAKVPADMHVTLPACWVWVYNHSATPARDSAPEDTDPGCGADAARHPADPAAPGPRP